MRKIFFAAAVIAGALAVAGCATVQKLTDIYTTVSTASVPSQDVVVAISAFDGYEVLADSYTKLPLCGAPTTSSPVCRTANIRRVVAASVASGRVARNNMKAFLRSNPTATSVPAADYNTLVGVLNTLQASLAAYKAQISAH